MEFHQNFASVTLWDNNKLIGVLGLTIKGQGPPPQQAEPTAETAADMYTHVQYVMYRLDIYPSFAADELGRQVDSVQWPNE